MKLKRSDDLSLINRIAHHDASALEELYDHYNRLVFSIAMAIVNDQSIAEEITLDIFVRVWKAAETYQPERGKVNTWLAAMTRNHSIDVLRWQKARLDQNSLYLDELPLLRELATPDPQDEVDAHSQNHRLRQAVARLPSDQREALLLAYFKGYSHRQIAEILHEPLGTIKTRIRLAMQKLREVFFEEPQPSDKSKGG